VNLKRIEIDHTVLKTYLYPIRGFIQCTASNRCGLRRRRL